MILGVFDSGVGGLSVLRTLTAHRRGDIVYLGDSLRAPYGNRTNKEIIQYAEEMIRWMISRGVTHFVSACNSISVQDTKALLASVGISHDRYYDMVSSTRNHIAQDISHKDKVLIFGTQATIASGAYQEVCAIHSDYATHASLHLAQAIEDGDLDKEEKEIQSLILACKKHTPTHVLLACTHYPLIIDKIKDKLKEHQMADIHLIDPAYYVKQDILIPAEPYTLSVYTTKHTPAYDIFTQGLDITHQEQISL